VFITFLVLLALAVPATFCLFRRQKLKSRAKRRAIEEELRKTAARLEQQMQGMFQVVSDMPIRLAEEYKRKVGADAVDKSSRSQAARWYWEEDDSRVDQHIAEMVMDGTNFVAYSGEICGQIEHAYKLYLERRGFKELRVDLTGKISSTKTGQKLANQHSGNFYEINFETMKQSNSQTNYERRVQREEIQMNVASEVYDDLPILPEDVDFTSEEKEDLLPTYKGQIIQVSKVHPGNEWMFGNVLYDPLMDEALRKPGYDSNDDLNAVLAYALHDRPTSGWFPRSVTKPADVQQMHKILKNLGRDGSDALAIPENWDEAEGRVQIRKGSPEYDEVVNYFLAALYGQRDKITVESVHRIQNVPLWQSYSVKKQTMKTRYSAGTSHLVNNKHNGLDGLERRWLFHGTVAEVMPKIEKQGFNRSFAGRNAVAYGRGVYFARDASYSCHPTYSVPDSKGVQHMFMCSVSVGDWCKGKNDQITPDSKSYNNFELFDSTVDNVSNPSIFVIYHDSQAFPEYLISFKQRR
jgi:poly [ADP-ribose] polymerase 10/14/15